MCELNEDSANLCELTLPIALVQREVDENLFNLTDLPGCDATKATTLGKVSTYACFHSHLNEY